MKHIVNLFCLFLLIWIVPVSSFAVDDEVQTPVTSPPAVAPPVDAPSAVESEAEDDYEVDYEEEGDLPEIKPKNRKKSDDKEITNQGSRAKNRFVPPAKSERKSVYKKNGVPLDVDTD